MVVRKCKRCDNGFDSNSYGDYCNPCNQYREKALDKAKKDAEHYFYKNRRESLEECYNCHGKRFIGVNSMRCDVCNGSGKLKKIISDDLIDEKLPSDFDRRTSW